MINKMEPSEKKFRHLFEESPYGILLFDLKGKLIESNHKLLEKLLLV